MDSQNSRGNSTIKTVGGLKRWKSWNFDSQRYSTRGFPRRPSAQDPQRGLVQPAQTWAVVKAGTCTWDTCSVLTCENWSPTCPTYVSRVWCPKWLCVAAPRLLHHSTVTGTIIESLRHPFQHRQTCCGRDQSPTQKARFEHHQERHQGGELHQLPLHSLLGGSVPARFHKGSVALAGLMLNRNHERKVLLPQFAVLHFFFRNLFYIGTVSQKWTGGFEGNLNVLCVALFWFFVVWHHVSTTGRIAEFPTRHVVLRGKKVLAAQQVETPEVAARFANDSERSEAKRNCKIGDCYCWGSVYDGFT